MDSEQRLAVSHRRGGFVELFTECAQASVKSPKSVNIFGSLPVMEFRIETSQDPEIASRKGVLKSTITILVRGQLVQQGQRCRVDVPLLLRCEADQAAHIADAPLQASSLACARFIGSAPPFKGFINAPGGFCQGGEIAHKVIGRCRFFQLYQQ